MVTWPSLVIVVANHNTGKLHQPVGRGERVLQAKRHQGADGDAPFAPRATARHQQSPEDAVRDGDGRRDNPGDGGPRRTTMFDASISIRSLT